MKQLRYFTKHSDSLDQAKKALMGMGIGKNNVHVFKKENSKNRFDGLLLESECKEENYLSEMAMWSISLLGLFGSYAISMSWIGFSGFTLVCFSFYGVLTFAGVLRGKSKPAMASNSVYFLVIEVDEALAPQVKNSLKGYYQFVRA